MVKYVILMFLTACWLITTYWAITAALTIYNGLKLKKAISNVIVRNRTVRITMPGTVLGIFYIDTDYSIEHMCKMCVNSKKCSLVFNRTNHSKLNVEITLK